MKTPSCGAPGEAGALPVVIDVSLKVTKVLARPPFVRYTPCVGVLLIGAIIGAFAGWRFKLAHRAWRDWRTTRAAVPRLRSAFYGHSRWSAVWVVAAVLAVLAALHGL